MLLYELLTGRTPFDLKELLGEGIDAIRRVIREREPLRPSTKLARLKREELTATAKRHSLEAPKLISLLKGDLDWIVMKCLEKDRTHRYDTASGLATEVMHYLADEPILARPPSRLYIFGKIVRRNKPVFLAGGVVTAVSIAGVLVGIWLAIRAGEAERMLGRLTTVQVNLPVATVRTKATFRPDMVNLFVDRRGDVWIEKEQKSFAVFSSYLSNRFLANPQVPVIINGDKDTPHGSMISVLDLVRRLGGQNVSFGSLLMDPDSFPVKVNVVDRETAPAPSLSYQVRGFLEKHKVGLAVAGITGLLLLAGITITTWLALLATRAKDRP